MRAIFFGGAGLALLLALVWLGAALRGIGHLALPGPVIGLALMAGILLLVKQRHARLHRRLNLCLSPVGRLLVSHMGLLFVPAGVGVMAESNMLKHAWLPVAAALAGSTLAGIIATGWFMHRAGANSTSEN